MKVGRCKMKLRKIIAVCIALMISLGSVSCVFADERALEIDITLNLEVVDKNGNPAEGVIMRLGHDGKAEFHTIGETGHITFNISPGKYELMEMGYENERYVYNDLWFEITKKAEVVVYDGNAEYEMTGRTSILWTCYDYENRYMVRVKLEDSQFTGSRVELLKKDGTLVDSWHLKEKGELVANLEPGAYTLRELVELNGYEIPMISNIMVGGAIITPVDPNVNEINPEEFSYYYDMFQKWIDNQN